MEEVVDFLELIRVENNEIDINGENFEEVFSSLEATLRIHVVLHRHQGMEEVGTYIIGTLAEQCRSDWKSLNPHLTSLPTLSSLFRESRVAHKSGKQLVAFRHPVFSLSNDGKRTKVANIFLDIWAKGQELVVISGLAAALASSVVFYSESAIKVKDWDWLKKVVGASLNTEALDRVQNLFLVSNCWERNLEYSVGYQKDDKFLTSTFPQTDQESASICKNMATSTTCFLIPKELDLKLLNAKKTLSQLLRILLEIDTGKTVNDHHAAGKDMTDIFSNIMSYKDFLDSNVTSVLEKLAAPQEDLPVCQLQNDEENEAQDSEEDEPEEKSLLPWQDWKHEESPAVTSSKAGNHDYIVPKGLENCIANETPRFEVDVKMAAFSPQSSSTHVRVTTEETLDAIFSKKEPIKLSLSARHCELENEYRNFTTRSFDVGQQINNKLHGHVDEEEIKKQIIETCLSPKSAGMYSKCETEAEGGRFENLPYSSSSFPVIPNGNSNLPPQIAASKNAIGDEHFGKLDSASLKAVNTGIPQPTESAMNATRERVLHTQIPPPKRPSPSPAYTNGSPQLLHPVSNNYPTFQTTPMKNILERKMNPPETNSNIIVGVLFDVEKVTIVSDTGVNVTMKNEVWSSSTEIIVGGGSNDASRDPMKIADVFKFFLSPNPARSMSAQRIEEIVKHVALSFLKLHSTSCLLVKSDEIRMGIFFPIFSCPHLAEIFINAASITGLDLVLGDEASAIMGILSQEVLKLSSPYDARKLIVINSLPKLKYSSVRVYKIEEKIVQVLKIGHDWDAEGVTGWFKSHCFVNALKSVVEHLQDASILVCPGENSETTANKLSKTYPKNKILKAGRQTLFDGMLDLIRNVDKLGEAFKLTRCLFNSATRWMQSANCKHGSVATPQYSDLNISKSQVLELAKIDRMSLTEYKNQAKDLLLEKMNKISKFDQNDVIEQIHSISTLPTKREVQNLMHWEYSEKFKMQ